MGKVADAFEAALGSAKRRFLCRRHKLRVAGTNRFGYAEVFGEVGVVDIHKTRLQRRPVHASS